MQPTELTAEDIKLLRKCLSGNPQLLQILDRLAASIATTLSTMRYDKDGKWILSNADKILLNKELNNLSSSIEILINSQVEWAWNLSNEKNDALVASYIDGLSISKSISAKFNQRNLDALKAFQSRKIDGKTLSNRVWDISNGSERILKSYLDTGIASGKSAAEISRDIRHLLKDPDALFRRVRNAKGELVPSTAMKNNRPGTGVYNSAYQNALRLAATETNMAYRTADHIRWQQIDFIAGYEVNISKEHHGKMPQGDICDYLKGRYPKDFIFVGWHPRCFCNATVILINREKFRDYLKLKAEGNDMEAEKILSKDQVVSLDPKVIQYIRDNETKIQGWKTEPYWLRDNFKVDSSGKYQPKIKKDTP